VPQAAGEADWEALCDALLRSYAGDLAQLHVHPPELVTSPGERPEASPLAREQARASALVTNLRRTGVRIEDDLGRRLVTLLERSRCVAELAAELRSWLEQSGHEMPEDLEDGLERSLVALAGLGFAAPLITGGCCRGTRVAGLEPLMRSRPGRATDLGVRDAGCHATVEVWPSGLHR
jgi:PKMT, C-terminal winged helix domain